MNYEIYHIPSNFTDAGKIFGMFEIRNVIETILLAVPMLYLCIALLPLALMPKIIVSLVVVIPVGGFVLTGIRDDSLTRWLKCWWGWKKRRRVMYYRGEAKQK